MKYEEYNPKDGHIYKFVWGWPDILTKSPKKYHKRDMIFISCIERICGSNFISILQTPFQISDVMNCSIELAQVIRMFAIQKFAELRNYDVNQVAMAIGRGELDKFILKMEEERKSNAKN